MRKKVLCALLCLLTLLTGSIYAEEAEDSYWSFLITEDTVLYEITDGMVVESGMLPAGTLCADLGIAAGLRAVQYRDGDIVKLGWIREADGKNVKKNMPSSTPAPRKLTMDEQLQQYGIPSVDAMKLLYPGTSECVVLTAEGTVYLPVSIVFYESPVDKEQRVATVFAEKTGKATLRTEPKDNGKAVATLMHGTVLEVTELLDGWAKVRVGENEGYMKNNVLKYWRERENLGHAVVCVKDNTDGSEAVTVRAKAASGAKKTGEWKTGTVITVLSEKGKWVEAEAEGLCGFIPAENVMLP